MDSRLPKRMQSTVARWYAGARRDLPWRNTHDPYAVLVSEVMLQQTQVDRVIPKYRAFLKRWPTVKGLARARRGEVLRLWSGLGYNRRAVNLHRAAQVIARDFHGRVPSTVNALEQLPGLGHYTARAVATFAFRQREAFVDTNIRRILGRVVFSKHHPTVADDTTLLAVAEKLVPSRRPDLWHHALMDLGASVCRPVPDCAVCPLRSMCSSYPAILGRPQRRTQRRSAPFAGSDRYWRGEVIRQLLAGPISQRTLADRVPSLKGVRRKRLLATLERDGLVERRSGGRLSLPR